MKFSIAKLLSHSDGARTFFSRQGVLFVVAVALFAVLWVTNVRGPGTGFVPVLLYTLIIGNLTTPIMNHLAPFSSRLRFPLDWIAYLTLLFFTAVAIVSLTLTIVMVLYGAPFNSFFAQLWSTGKLVVVVILIGLAAPVQFSSEGLKQNSLSKTWAEEWRIMDSLGMPG